MLSELHRHIFVNLERLSFLFLCLTAQIHTYKLPLLCSFTLSLVEKGNPEVCRSVCPSSLWLSPDLGFTVSQGSAFHLGIGQRKSGIRAFSLAWPEKRLQSAVSRSAAGRRRVSYDPEQHKK